METPAPRFGLTRLMFGNATLLSALYLGFGLVVELVRRRTGARWADRMSFALDALPARALELTHLLGPLRSWYLEGAISEFWLRVVFGATTVLIIFAMALLVGLGMWAVRAWVQRSSDVQV